MRTLFNFEIIGLIRDMRWAARVLREEGRPVVAEALDDRIMTLLGRIVPDVAVEPIPEEIVAASLSKEPA